MRARFTVAALSMLVCVLILTRLCLKPPPPATVLVTRPKAVRKVSVIVTLPNLAQTQQLDTLCTGIAQVLTQDKLESEFLVAGLDKLTSDLQDLKVKGHHVELVPQGSGFTETILNAFEQAHFSVVLVVSDILMSVQLVPLLVEPVVSRATDIMLTQHGSSSLLMGLLSFPLTHSTAGGLNSSDFCLHRAVWKRACPGVFPRAASLSLELLARCSLHSHSVLVVGGESRHELHSTALLPQIIVLYVCMHPLWSFVVVAMVVLVTVRCTRVRPINTILQSNSKLV